MSNVYPVADDAGYDGSGLAMAAVEDGRAVKVQYLRDIVEDYDESRTSPLTWLTYANHDEVKQAAQALEAFGTVSVGMCSAWEFVEY